jgi:hypothetical protein
MNKDDEFRQRAAEAQEYADRAVSPVDRDGWLTVAKGWLALIRKPQPSAKDTFDAKAEVLVRQQHTNEKDEK